MNHLRSSGAMVLATFLFVVGYVLIGPMSVFASTSIPPTVPEAIAVPAGHVLLFSSHAEGVQTYECQNGQWVFHAPRALLFDSQTEQPSALHYGGVDRNLTPGPWWDAMRDDSRIRAGNAKIAPSPNPDSIPLLRLQVLDWEGAGVFRPVDYIQRLNTVGGVGPTGACDTSARVGVDYTADYYFYGTS